MDSLCLGPVEIGPPGQCIDLDARQVTVRRENSEGEEVFLMEELTKYVEKRFANYARESLFYPNTGLHIDPEILQSTEGFPEAGLTRADVHKDWTTAVHGYQKAAKLLESVFSGRPSIIINGLHQENLLKLAADNNMLAGNDIDANLTNKNKIIVIDGTSKTIIEVICSASGTEESTLKEEILQMNLELQNGRNLFTKVFVPAAKLSERWTWLGLLCLPQVENRSVLVERHRLYPSMVQFILTKQELCGDADSLRAQLRLKNTEAAKDEYGRAVVLCVGLERISFDTQIFSYQKDIQETLTRIVGEREERDVIGLGGGVAAQLAGAETIHFSQLRGKPLGSLPNIIFWNDVQMKILSSLMHLMFAVMFGDFGGGKTSVLVACALELANKFPVFFVSGLDTLTKEEDSIMDIALETKWKNFSVQVVTVSRMRRELGKGMDVTVPELIQDFIEVHCNPPGEAVFIIDELPVSIDDLKKMTTGEETQLKQLLVKLQEKSKVAWVALSTSSLLEKQIDDIILPGNRNMSQVVVERLVGITGLCLIILVITLPILTITHLTGHTGITSLCTVAALFIIILCVVWCKHNTAGISISPTTLPSYLSTLPAYTQVHLQRNMRSSGMIAASADPGDVGKYNSASAGYRSVMRSALPPLLASTIAGTIRPHLVMAPWARRGLQPDYPAIARGIHHSLSTIFHLPTPVTRQHVAILVGQGISPREVATCLNLSPLHTTLYSAGIEQYDRYGRSEYDQTSATSAQRDEVTKWLTGPGGILITHSHLYKGMEVGYAVYVTDGLGNDRDIRSNILRAVGALCVVTRSRMVYKVGAMKNFSVVECTTACACVNHDTDTDTELTQFI